MKLNKQDVTKLAELANLQVSDDQVDALIPQLNDILDYVGQLQKVDTTSVDVTNEVTGLKNIYRHDQIGESLEKPPQSIKVAAVLKNRDN